MHSIYYLPTTFRKWDIFQTFPMYCFVSSLLDIGSLFFLPSVMAFHFVISPTLNISRNHVLFCSFNSICCIVYRHRTDVCSNISCCKSIFSTYSGPTYKSTIFGLVDIGLAFALVVNVIGIDSWLTSLIMGSAEFAVSNTVVGTRHFPSKWWWPPLFDWFALLLRFERVDVADV